MGFDSERRPSRDRVATPNKGENLRRYLPFIIIAAVALLMLTGGTILYPRKAISNVRLASSLRVRLAS